MSKLSENKHRCLPQSFDLSGKKQKKIISFNRCVKLTSRNKKKYFLFLKASNLFQDSNNGKQF